MALPNSSKFYPKIVEICKLDSSNTHLHDRPLSWHSTGTSMTKSDGIKLVLWTQTSPLSEMMRSCQCSQHVSKIPTLIYNWVIRQICKMS